MQFQYQEFFQHFNILFYTTIGCSCVGILLSRKIPSLLKFPTIICILFASSLAMFPAKVEECMGSATQSIAMACFIFAAAALAFSFYKFLRAGMTIAFWLFITAVVGSTAFPNVVNQKLSSVVAESGITQHQMQSDLVGYVTQRLSFHQ